MKNTLNNKTKKIITAILLCMLLFSAAIFISSCKSEGFVFTCNIKDGAVYEVKNPAFDITVYYRGNVCGIAVKCNDRPVAPSEDGKYVAELKAGKNVISVTAVYGDKSDGATYAVYYEEKDFEIVTDLAEKKIVNGRMDFSAKAFCNGEETSLAVLFGGERLQGNNGVYSCGLKNGYNEFEFIAGIGSASCTEKQTVYFGKFRLNTTLKSGETDKNTVEFRAVASYDNEICKVNVTVNGEELTTDKNSFAYVFPASGEYEFCLTATTEKAEYSEYYTLTYCDLPPYFDILTFENGKVCKGELYSFDVAAKNGLGKKMPDSSIVFSADFNADDGTDNFEALDGGEIYKLWSDDVKTSYALKFNAGKYKNAFGKKTVLRVTATYGEKSVYKDFEITYVGADEDGKIGKVTLSIEAFTIGCGYLLAPLSVDVYSGENFATYLCSIIENNGWTYSYTGEVKNGFYLASIGGLDLTGNAIDKNLLSRMRQNGENIFATSISARDDGKYNLGEFDFASGSGWMYSVNGVFPNYGFSNYYPQDGDVIRLQFTLCLGKDLGGSDAIGFGGKNYVDKLTDYGKISALAADIAANSYYGKGEEKLLSEFDKIAVWNADETTVEIAYTELKKYYFDNF